MNRCLYNSRIEEFIHADDSIFGKLCEKIPRRGSYNHERSVEI